MLRRDEIEAIAGMHRAGMSVRAIASAGGWSPSTVHGLVRELDPDVSSPTGDIQIVSARRTVGIDGKRRLNRLVDTTERDGRIRELRSQGVSIRAIAAKVECSVGTVHRIVRTASVAAP